MSINHFTDLDDGLAVGSFPSGDVDARFLASRGVTALVSLQSDSDLLEHDLSWDVLVGGYDRVGIEATRVGVTDFDRMDLLRHIDRAIAAACAYAAAGRKIYIHCNAGLNRSPCTLTGFLVAHRGLSLEEAITWIETRHRCILYYDVLEAWNDRRTA